MDGETGSYELLRTVFVSDHEEDVGGSDFSDFVSRSVEDLFVAEFLSICRVSDCWSVVGTDLEAADTLDSSFPLLDQNRYWVEASLEVWADWRSN